MNKTIKDLKVNDICFLVRNDGSLLSLKCYSIKKAKSCNIDYFDIAFTTNYNTLMRYSEFGEISSIVDTKHTIFLNKEDVIKHIDIIESNCLISKVLLEQY